MIELLLIVWTFFFPPEIVVNDPLPIEYAEVDEYITPERLIAQVQALNEEPLGEIVEVFDGDVYDYTNTKSDGIYIDLSKKELELWQDGRVRLFPILAIREGFKNYNTPTGDFEALYKNVNHLSSYFDVWMPYSIQFYGDYFLHGYPTYNDEARTLVPFGTSGGCIRMNTEDMKEIFEATKIGTPIIIIK